MNPYVSSLRSQNKNRSPAQDELLGGIVEGQFGGGSLVQLAISVPTLLRLTLIDPDLQQEKKQAAKNHWKGSNSSETIALPFRSWADNFVPDQHWTLHKMAELNREPFIITGLGPNALSNSLALIRLLLAT